MEEIEEEKNQNESSNKGSRKRDLVKMLRENK
jgi:hypothetical protein